MERQWIKSRKPEIPKEPKCKSQESKNKYRNFKSEIRREYNLGAHERKTKKWKILLGTGPYISWQAIP
jgi:hypothetical protein